MSSDRCYLITLLNGPNGINGVLQCALKVDEKKAEEYFMEPDARERLRALLPLHVRSCGPIVDVVEIFEIADLS